MEGNGICSAAFCESAALRKRFFAEFQRAEPSQSSLRDASSPEGGAFCMAVQFPAKPQNLRACRSPLGELSRSD